MIQSEVELSTGTSLKLPFEKGSLLYAPMEGITDNIYRSLILEHYPHWDYVATDFLRLPSVGIYPDKHILKHMGPKSYRNKWQHKTIYQILTADNALTEYHVSRISELGFKWLDINLGCPSKTVCKNKGGSFLLSELPTLRRIIRTIRENFPHTFTAKIRVGYEDDSNFENILKLLEEEGVNAVTIHARTRMELYKGVANWEYVKKAVKAINIPVVGNGDIWTLEDIHRYFDFTGCHSIMLARSAMKSPWLAEYYKENKPLTLSDKAHEVNLFFNRFYEIVKDLPLDDKFKGRKLKAASRYSFDDFPDGDQIKKKFLLSQDPVQMLGILEQLKDNFVH